MTDIVERLLKRGANALLIKEKPDLHYDAANEIERLRLELDMVQATILVPSQKDDRRTIERLREELVSALDDAARLREAVKEAKEAERQRWVRALVRKLPQDMSVLFRDICVAAAMGESNE